MDWKTDKEAHFEVQSEVDWNQKRNRSKRSEGEDFLCRGRGQGSHPHPPHPSMTRQVRTVRVETQEDRVPYRGSDTQSGAPRAWGPFAHSL